MESFEANQLLVINAGSSSIKFALFAGSGTPQRILRGEVSRIGTSGSGFAVTGDATISCRRQFAIPDHVTAASVLQDWLREHVPAGSLKAVGHRVVHGGPVCCATRVLDQALMAALHASAAFQPEHLPQELHLMDMLRRDFPSAVQLACFDSAFHASMPLVATMLPIPRHYHAEGVRRYGFHGLSCAWLMRELARTDPPAALGKVVIAHLGGGASVTAVRAGKSCDTTMGLSAASGIMSGCRSGDLDPALGWVLARREHMTESAFHHMVNHQSGLLGVSCTSGDLQVLLAHEEYDGRAASAVAMFCYQVRKAIWSMAGAMDGMDTLIFSGGIGEHAAAVRARVCASLSGLGVVLDEGCNARHEALISSAASKVAVRVLRSDEEAMMADETWAWLEAHSAAAKAGP